MAFCTVANLGVRVNQNLDRDEPSQMLFQSVSPLATFITGDRNDYFHLSVWFQVVEKET